MNVAQRIRVVTSFSLTDKSLKFQIIVNQVNLKYFNP